VIYGVLFGESEAAKTEVGHYRAEEWSPRAPGDLLDSGTTSSPPIYAPNAWGLEGYNKTLGHTGLQSSIPGQCELDLWGAGTRIYASKWFAPSGCVPKEARWYVLWKPLTEMAKCSGTICTGIEAKSYSGAGQPSLPTTKQLEERTQTQLKSAEYPVLNRFLNYLAEPENFPDPRVTKKKVDEEERRCDRGTPQFENAGGNLSPEPFAKEDEAEFSVASRPEGFESTPVYLRWGTTSWIPGKAGFSETPYLDLWSGWGYRHIAAKHGWNAVDREETELTLSTGTPVETGAGNWLYTTTAIPTGVGGVECERRVVVDFRTREGDPAPRGIVTSFNTVVP
jgi:hypothetical protein